MSELTREQKRIRIAEACGWKQVEQSNGDYINGPSPMYPWTNGKDWSDESGEDLPDYFNDLNAMHEAEKALTDSQGGDYDSHLWLIIQRDKSRPASWHATAEQRAEAFGRTLNLW